MKNLFMKMVLFLSVIVFVFASSCNQQKDEAAETENMAVKAKEYVLGSSLAITGPTGDIGSPYSKGIEDYCRYANEMKLLGNDTVKCLVRDDAYKTETTKQNFEDFLEQGMVLYLNYSTGSTLGLKQDFEEEKIPVLPASFHYGNLENSNYIFLPIASYSEQAIGLAEYVVKNHKGKTPKVAMFIHPSAFGRGPVNDVKKAVEAGLKIDIVEVVEHAKDLDYTALIKRLTSKGVQYVIAHTVQPPVATLLKDTKRLGKDAKFFGEKGKLTFLAAHYACGPDLIKLAGSAAENYYCTTSYTFPTTEGPGKDAQLALAKLVNRDDAVAYSQNYTNGLMVTQIAVEAMRRVKAKDMEVSKETLYDELNAMNGINSYFPLTTVGPVSFSKTDRAGVDSLQLYKAQNGVFNAVGQPFTSAYFRKIQ